MAGQQHLQKPTITKLWVNWRRGDVEAQELLTVRLGQWFETLITLYVNPEHRHTVSNATYKIFNNRIATIHKHRDLVPFLHELVLTEISKHRTDIARPKEQKYTLRLPNSGEPSTDSRHKIDIENALKRAWRLLPNQSQECLAIVYGQQRLPSSTPQQSSSQLEAGMREALLKHNPYEFLKARNNLKEALMKVCNIEFRYASTSNNRDLAPLPFYEGQKMYRSKELIYFERWLLNAPSVCEDISEFTPFIQALRGGLADKLMPFRATQRPENAPVAAAEDAEQPTAETPSDESISEDLQSISENSTWVSPATSEQESDEPVHATEALDVQTPDTSEETEAQSAAADARLAPETPQATAPQAEKEPTITEESISEDEAVQALPEQVLETENNASGFDNKALIMQVIIGLVIAIIIAAFFLT